MENIFYSVLALHVAGRPISKDNIRAVLNAADTPVDEAALDAMAAFLESLEAEQQYRKKPVDPRIVKFLTSELARQRLRMKELESLLNEGKTPYSSERKTVPDEMKAEAREKESGNSREAIGESGEAQTVSVFQHSGNISRDKAHYLYGVGFSGGSVNLDSAGIEGNAVYTIPYGELCAVVHDCIAEPYQSEDEETVKGWVTTHQRVVDEARERFATVIPFGFDTILKTPDGVASSEQAIKDWLKENYGHLIRLMEKIQAKDEYGVQVFYDPVSIGEEFANQSQEIINIKDEMATKSKGIAYMYRQRLEKTLKARIDRLASEWFDEFYKRIKEHTEDVVVEKSKKASKDKVMLLSLSCLVAREKVSDLGEVLEKIENRKGFSVHFSGPWPPYSFVALPGSDSKREAK
jgi:hypothetical protein